MDWRGLALASGLASVLTVISIVDLRQHRVPDALSLPLLAAGFAVALGVSEQPFMRHVVGALVGFSLFAVIGEIHFRLRRSEGLGLGDAKLFAAAGSWMGWPALPMVLMAASLSAVAFALVAWRHSLSGRRVPFAPFLSFGFWSVWMFGAPGLEPSWR